MVVWSVVMPDIAIYLLANPIGDTTARQQCKGRMKATAADQILREPNTSHYDNEV